MLLKYLNLFEGELDEWARNYLCLQHECSFYAYNTSIPSSTGFSPAEIMFGRKCRVPLYIMYGYGSNKEHHSDNRNRLLTTAGKYKTTSSNRIQIFMYFNLTARSSRYGGRGLCSITRITSFIQS